MTLLARLAVLGICIGLVGCAEPVEGHVVAVIDGDTFEAIIEGERRRVRIVEIDTPERRQPWANQARRALAELIAGREVQIDIVGFDRYGRTLAAVTADGVSVGNALVRAGHAWAYREADDLALRALEAGARRARRGLWGAGDEEPVPPWEWRAQHPNGGR